MKNRKNRNRLNIVVSVIVAGVALFALAYKQGNNIKTYPKPINTQESGNLGTRMMDPNTSQQEHEAITSETGAINPPTNPELLDSVADSLGTDGENAPLSEDLAEATQDQLPDQTQDGSYTRAGETIEQEIPANLPPEMVRQLTQPPPPLPPDLKAQLNAPPPELPEDLKRQLNSPPPSLPPDLQAQLNTPPPPIPEDIQKALETPPRVVDIEEVNNPDAIP